MSMYGLDASMYDYGFSSDTAIASSIYGHRIDFDDEHYYRRTPPSVTHAPPEYRHDGSSPLPLGIDWSLPPRVWEGRHTVWPYEPNKKWSYCVTVPSWTKRSDTEFFILQIGIQSPEGVTSTRQVPRRFKEFLKLYSELKKEFPKKKLPPAPPKMLTKSDTLLEERRGALEVWMEKLLTDVKVSRTASVAIFLELEAAARQSCSELNLNDSVANTVSSGQFVSNATSLTEGGSSVTSDLDNSSAIETSEYQKHSEPNIESERFSDMQRDLEELTRKCMELELRLTVEQDARAHAESIAATAIQQNKMLTSELDDAKKQVVFER
ncbi:PX domain-containing protein EREL1-like [Bidens hawaiensis]|uniref:PX domain-containing protein EREL1-like n=1 Tax=Bidens hawaiensis TaxID=980011 RepID=UPI00404B3A45